MGPSVSLVSAQRRTREKDRRDHDIMTMKSTDEKTIRPPLSSVLRSSFRDFILCRGPSVLAGLKPARHGRIKHLSAHSQLELSLRAGAKGARDGFVMSSWRPGAKETCRSSGRRKSPSLSGFNDFMSGLMREMNVISFRLLRLQAPWSHDPWSQQPEDDTDDRQIHSFSFTIHRLMPSDGTVDQGKSGSVVS